MNCGGVAKASISVLKLVISIQKIGKNSSSATPQASTPTSKVLRRRLCFSVSIGLSSIFLGEILAEHPHQDDRRDIGDDHGDQAARRRHADVELQQRLGVDQVGEVGGGVAGAAAGGGEDFGEDREQEDGLDHHHH